MKGKGKIYIWDNGRDYTDHALFFYDNEGLSDEDTVAILRANDNPTSIYPTAGHVVAVAGEIEWRSDEAIPISQLAQTSRACAIAPAACASLVGWEAVARLIDEEIAREQTEVERGRGSADYWAKKTLPAHERLLATCLESRARAEFERFNAACGDVAPVES